MSNREETQNNESQKTRGSTKLVRSLHLMIIVLLSAWIALAYLHVAYLPGFMTGILTANGFVLRVALIAVLGGFILSRPIFRNLSRRRKTSQVKVQPIPQLRGPGDHPLFRTSRPARDTNFVIRKTKNRGRISRNRAGERLPPSYQE